METVERPTQILKRLNSCDDPAKVKEEAEKFLAAVRPADLSIAEQNLIDEELTASDLQRPCSIHLELLKDQVEKMKSQLPPGRVVWTLVSERASK